MRWLGPLTLPLCVFLAGMNTAQAATVSHEITPVTGTFINPCNGEAITVNGNLNTVIQMFADSSGGHHLDINDNGQGISGVDTSGTTYSVPDVAHFTSNSTSGAYEGSFTDHFAMISHGSASNLELILTSHITYDASGTLTSYHVYFDTGCKA